MLDANNMPPGREGCLLWILCIPSRLFPNPDPQNERKPSVTDASQDVCHGGPASDPAQRDSAWDCRSMLPVASAAKKMG